MHLLSNAVRSAALAALSLSLMGGAALASDNKIAVVPGGPHPYFAPWGAGGGRRQEGFWDRRRPVQSAYRLEARATD